MRTNLLICFGVTALVFFGIIAIASVIAKALRNPVIHDKPQPDSRRDAYANFMRDVK